jgi:glycosyltransferase involved in cell wall biosynthesis
LPIMQASEHPTAPGLGDCAIVYFGNDWRSENRTSSHHVAIRLSRHTRVLYVESPGMRAPNMSGRDLSKAIRKLRATFQAPEPVAPGLWKCTIPQIPFRRFALVRALNRLFAQWVARRKIRAAGIRKFMSWFVVPHPGFLAGRLGEEFVVYYCIDDYSAHPGVDVEEIQRLDDALSRRADRLFVAPPALLEHKAAINPATVPAPHGVDVQHFGRAADGTIDPPARARDIRHPVVGFFGSLAEWIDIGLLEHIARQRPQYTLLLIGYCSVDVTKLAGLPNVVLAGPVPYEDLPAWASVFDVAILPYLRNRQVINSNPLKLREYLATGRPVVAVRAPAIEEFADVVAIADSPDEFILAIDRAIAGGPDEEARLSRLRRIADQSWDARVERVVGIVGSDLANRSRRGR